MAREFVHLNVDVSDLVQEGACALVIAAKAFDSGRRVPFEAYARKRIRGAMVDYLSRQSLLSVSDWGARKLRRFQREDRAQRMGNEPTNIEWREAHSVERRLDHEALSLDSVGQERAPFAEPHETVAAETLAAHVQEALDALPSMAAELIRRRAGLDGRHGQTLEELSEFFGVSREELRQLERTTLHALVGHVSIGAAATLLKS